VQQTSRAIGWGVIAVVSLFTVSASSQAAQKPYTEVPFEFAHGVIVLSVAINGHGSLHMLLDTGVDPSVVDLGTAKRIELKLASEGERGSGLGTDVNLTYRTEFESLQVGALTATHVEAAAIDLSKVSARLGQRIDGVLGYSLLRGRIVQIAYPKRTIRFYNTAPRCADSQFRNSRCFELAFVYKEEILASGVLVDGHPVVANIDTGSDSELEIGPATIERLGLSNDALRGRPGSATGFNGEAKSTEGSVRSLNVGVFSINEPPTVFYGKGTGVDDEPWDVRLGGAFLKDFTVTVDFRNDRIILAKGKPKDKSP
jgi:hypothetical protein